MPHTVVTFDAARRATALAAVCIGILLLAACASPPKPTRLDGRIEASALVNPSVSQRPSPVLLRVYELKSATLFNAADFMALYQRDSAELAAEVVGRDDVMLNPGESRALVKTLAPETRFIGVIAAYRNVERAVWRTAVPVQLNKKNRLVIRADELAVSAKVEQ